MSQIEASDILIRNSDLKYLRTYPRIEKTYLYQESVGCYQEITDGELKVCVRSILSNLKLNRLINRSYVDNLIYCLKFDPVIAQEGDPTPDRNFLVVENGLLNITTREVRQWSPEVFALNRVPYVYSGMKAIPKFETFLDDFTGGDQDKKKFVRATLNALLYSRVELQIFIYIYGKGGTGKSTLAIIAVALVGLESTHSTSLKAINTDPYEIINLIGKKLILMSDTESYSANVSQLKALTGQDAVRGRVMYQNKTLEVKLSGLILIIGNKLLNTRDTSDTITRRMRPFKADHKAKKVLTMLESIVIGGEQKWRGELAEELPGILHWVLTCDPQAVTSHLVNAANIPALVEGISEAKQTLDPVSSWIDDETIPCTQEDGSYVGFMWVLYLAMQQLNASPWIGWCCFLHTHGGANEGV